MGSQGERREKGEDGRGQVGRGGVRLFAAFSALPKNHFSDSSNSSPFCLLRACPAGALGIRLVYTAHYARFAVAIATTRGQFIEGEEVHFWGVSFPAPVQSTAENKDPETAEETHGEVSYEQKHHSEPKTSLSNAAFFPCWKSCPRTADRRGKVSTLHLADFPLSQPPLTPLLCLKDL